MKLLKLLAVPVLATALAVSPLAGLHDGDTPTTADAKKKSPKKSHSYKAKKASPSYYVIIDAGKSKHLNVRSTPSTKSRVIGKLKSGKMVKTYGKYYSKADRRYFYKVKVNGKYGYVAVQYTYRAH